MKRKIITFLLVICLVAGHIPPIAAYAADETASQETVAANEIADDDGLSSRIAGENTEDFYGISTFSRSGAVTHNPKFNGYDIQHGIDISYHNNYAKDGLWYNIDWNKVKADGIDFAIIRTAYRGYGQAGNIKPDTQVNANLKNAKAAGLEIGVYFFSQAITVAEAEEEAAYILNQIKGYDIDLPVVMDFEYTAGEDGRLYAAKLTDRQRTNICKAFCKKVEDAGYEAMVYANKSMLTNSLYADELTAAGYEIWLAEWGTKASYDKDYTYWQYTSDGSVNGVPSARVDMNYRYVEPSVKVGSRTDTSMTITWNKNQEAEGYYIYRRGAGEAFAKIAEVSGTDVTSYIDQNLKAKTVYAYKVNCYKTEEDGTITEFSSGSNEVVGYTSVKFAPMTLAGAAVDAGNVKLSWAASNLADGYQLQYYSSSKKAYTTIKTVKANEPLNYTHSGLKPALNYSYRIRPYAVIGGETVCGSWSPAIKVKTASTLKKPTLTGKKYSYTTNKLSWTKVPGAAGYQVQRYNSTKKKYTTIKTIKSGSTCSFSNTYLNANTTYKYRVRAYATVSGKKVYSPYSAIKSVKTMGNRSGKVKTSKLTVRTGAGTKYKKLTSVKKNKKLTITGSRSGWYRIKIKVKGKYRTGYVSKKYVTLLKK